MRRKGKGFFRIPEVKVTIAIGSSIATVAIGMSRSSISQEAPAAPLPMRPRSRSPRVAPTPPGPESSPSSPVWAPARIGPYCTIASELDQGLIGPGADDDATEAEGVEPAE